MNPTPQGANFATSDGQLAGASEESLDEIVERLDKEGSEDLSEATDSLAWGKKKD